VPYDVKRLNAIYQGEAEISDRDAAVEIIAGMVETMVRGHPKPSPAMEDRYRAQLRTLHEVLRRLGVDVELPSSLRRWVADLPRDIPTFLARDKADEVFEPVLDGLDEREHGTQAYAGDVRALDDPSDPASGAPTRAPPPAVDDPASIFISYSHDDKELARALYDRLRARGHNVWIDEHELRVGDSLIERISTAIADIDFFLALVSPAAAQSHWCRKELALAVSGELNRKGMRVMPLRVDAAEMPAALDDQLYLDVSLDDVDNAVERLLRDIASYRAEAKQTVEEARAAGQAQAGERAARVQDNGSAAEPFQFEPVRIVGVVEEGVGKPLNDGSRGSALYRVPLQLSRRPSRVWAELFKRNWDGPPSFTTMHRPGIGSVQGDTVVLDSTTMDELETVHLSTLRAVMDKTNADVAEIERREHDAFQREKQQRRSHEENVREVSRRLRSD
jgi:TIR domain-containing protein